MTRVTPYWPGGAVILVLLAKKKINNYFTAQTGFVRGDPGHAVVFHILKWKKLKDPFGIPSTHQSINP